MKRDSPTPYLAALASVLGALTLLPVLSSPSWLPPALLLVALVLVSGIGLRATTRSVALILAGQCVIGVIGLGILFARDQAFLGLLPGPAALHAMVDLGRDGIDATHHYSTPAPPVIGIRFLLASGILGVAIAVDFFAATFGAAVAAGLPLLALYCVPAALLPGGASPLSFVLVAGGWLLLMSHDGRTRVSGWGRVLNKYPDGARRRFGEDDLDALGSSARRLGALAVVAALVVPLLLPNLPNGLLTSGGGGDGSGNGTGKGNAVSVDPILTLRQNLTARSSNPVLTFSTAQTNPPPLRLVTDDRFDGESWRTSDGRPELTQTLSSIPLPDGLSSQTASTAYRMNVKVTTLSQGYLPVPYPVRTVEVDGPWVYAADTLDVIGRGRTTQNLSYSLTYLDVQPTIAQLKAATPPPTDLTDRYLELPSGLSPTILRTARQITSGLTNDYDKAAALQDWFRNKGGFVYDTDVSQTDARGDAVSAFLRSKHGYCVQFSSAMAVMARLLGIPARIAVGFLPGTRRSDGSRAVSLNDAHAWPELYFEGAGWVRFEPTPAVRTGAPPTYSEVPSASATATATSSATASSSASASSDPRHLQDLVPVKTTPLGGAGSSSGHPLLIPVKVLVVVALLLALLFATPVTAVLSRRRRRRHAGTALARVEAAWTELFERIADLGFDPPTGSTPRQSADLLAEHASLSGEPREALARIQVVVERARYSPRSPDQADLDRLPADLDAVLAAVRARCDLADRLRARVLPRSGTDRILRISSRAGEQIGRVDRKIARTGRTVTRGPALRDRTDRRRRMFRRSH